MGKTWDERRWEWLRVGKRIELVTFLLAVFSFLVFAIPATLYTEPGIASDASARPMSLGRVYALMAAVTLGSAAFQATHLKTFGRIFGSSVVSVFLWNFGILGVVVAI